MSRTDERMAPPPSLVPRNDLPFWKFSRRKARPPPVRSRMRSYPPPSRIGRRSGRKGLGSSAGGLRGRPQGGSPTEMRTHRGLLEGERDRGVLSIGELEAGLVRSPPGPCTCRTCRRRLRCRDWHRWNVRRVVHHPGPSRSEVTRPPATTDLVRSEYSIETTQHSSPRGPEPLILPSLVALASYRTWVTSTQAGERHPCPR